MNARTSRRFAAVLAGVAALAVMAPAAFAADSVAQSVTGGTRTASIADLTLGAVSYSHADQNSDGTMVLTADDSSGTGQGWNVTVQAGEFAYSGDNSGTAIGASSFSLVSAAAPVRTAGQDVDATGTDAAPTGPQLGTLAGVSGTLDQARTVVRAGTDFGQGTYTQDLSVRLVVPGQSRAGTYTSTLTTTITAGP